MVDSSLIKNIKLFILDVDGVLTDGGIYFGTEGQVLRRFNVQDGQGIKALQEKGIELAIITGHHSEAVTQRSQQLGIKHVYQGVSDKIVVLEVLLQQLRIRKEEVAYVGDDLADLPVLKQVGFPIAVKNAVAEVRGVALYVTTKLGGNGAVREVCDLFLNTRNDDDLKTVGVVPVRYASTRFPGKPLAEINGCPMVYHVYQQAQRARLLDEVIVATDDQRIVIYGYQRDALLRYATLPRSPLEIAEALEQLRALENGLKIRVVDTEYRSVGVDTPSDIELVERILNQKEN